MDSTKERVEAFIAYKNLSNKTFEEKCQLGNGFVSKIGKTIRETKLELISKAFPELNIEWIEKGVGEMLGEHTNISNISKTDTKEHKPYTTYLLPMSAMGGSLGGFSADSAMLHNCEAIVSPIENVDFAITVYGESMSPEYPSGSRVLIKQINPDIFIDWGKVYVLDTANGVIVKEIHESEIEGHVKCHSINPDPKFKPFNVPCSEVYNWYRVLMCLSIK